MDTYFSCNYCILCPCLFAKVRLHNFRIFSVLNFSMARTVKNPKIDSRSARSKLPKRREPYWTDARSVTGRAQKAGRGSPGSAVTMDVSIMRHWARPTTRESQTV